LRCVTKAHDIILELGYNIWQIAIQNGLSSPHHSYSFGATISKVAVLVETNLE
jgi:hypothetical protein